MLAETTNTSLGVYMYVSVVNTPWPRTFPQMKKELSIGNYSSLRRSKAYPGKWNGLTVLGLRYM